MMADDGAEAGTALRGIALMVLATLVFAVMNALVKWLGADYTTVQLVFFRNFFALLPVLFVVCRARNLGLLATRRPFAHLRRAVIGIISLGAFFYAYAHMPIANVTAIAFTAPLFVTALSVPLLGEAVGLRRWSAVIVGFLGVLVMVRPDGADFDYVALVALGGAFLYALVMIYVREMSHTETSTGIVFYYLTSSSLLLAAALPFFWVSPDLEGWLLLIALGLVGGIGQLVMTTAFRLGDAALIAPFDYVAIIWTSMIGFFIWGEVPKTTLWLGVAIVVASGLYIVHREARLALGRRRPPL